MNEAIEALRGAIERISRDRPLPWFASQDFTVPDGKPMGWTFWSGRVGENNFDRHDFRVGDIAFATTESESIPSQLGLLANHLPEILARLELAESREAEWATRSMNTALHNENEALRAENERLLNGLRGLGEAVRGIDPGLMAAWCSE